MPTFGNFNPAMWKVTTAAGAASATSIAISGLAVDDVIIECQAVTASGVLTEDRTATTTIDSAGNIKIEGTTVDKLIILRWLDVSAAEG